MKRDIFGFVLIALAFCSRASATIVTINPDNYVAGSDLSNVTLGVTLSTYSNSYFGNTQPDFRPLYSVDCAACSTGAFNGQHVFGSTPTQSVFADAVRPGLIGPNDLYIPPFLTMRADFLNPTNYVQIVGGAYNFGTTPVSLFAFDSGGNLLAKCAADGYSGFNQCSYIDLGIPTPNHYAGHYDPWELSINTGTYNIAYVIAGGLSAGSLVKSMTFASVPEPSSLGLLGLGLFAMGFVRRRV